MIARFYLRKYVPSDGLWHHRFMMIVLTLLMVASVIVAFGPHIVSIFVYKCNLYRNNTSARLSYIDNVFKFCLTKDRT